jgi:hypothetical protein
VASAIAKNGRRKQYCGRSVARLRASDGDAGGRTRLAADGANAGVFAQPGHRAASPHINAIIREIEPLIRGTVDALVEVAYSLDQDLWPAGGDAIAAARQCRAAAPEPRLSHACDRAQPPPGLPPPTILREAA